MVILKYFLIGLGLISDILKISIIVKINFLLLSLINALLDLIQPFLKKNTYVNIRKRIVNKVDIKFIIIYWNNLVTHDSK